LQIIVSEGPLRRRRVEFAGAGGCSGIRHERKYSFVRNSGVFILNISSANQDNCRGPTGFDRAIAAKLAAFWQKIEIGAYYVVGSNAIPRSLMTANWSNIARTPFLILRPANEMIPRAEEITGLTSGRKPAGCRV
jgi:hypothetical protein